MTPDELPAADQSTIAQIRKLVAAHVPEHRVTSVVQIGEGAENVAYDVDGALIVRFRKDGRADLLEREVQLLTAVGQISRIAIPLPVFSSPQVGCLAYRKVPGVPLSELPRAATTPRAAAIGAILGTLLHELHAAPIADMARLVHTDDQSLAGWRQDAADLYAKLGEIVPVAHRAAIEDFLAAPLPARGQTTVFSHNDLGIEHVLVDPATWTVTGIIDWSDAALCDPAFDFGLIHRDLGPTALAAALAAYQPAVDLHARAVFYARCSVLEDIVYGLDVNNTRFVEHGLAALEWLFPAPTT